MMVKVVAGAESRDEREESDEDEMKTETGGEDIRVVDTGPLPAGQLAPGPSSIPA